MRITTRLGVGLAVVAALTVGATAYQLGVISQLRDLNEGLALTHVEAARISLRVVENVEGMSFFAGSYLMRGALEDRERWVEYEVAVEADLSRLENLELSQSEEEQRQELLEAWEDYRRTAGPGPDLSTPRLRPSVLPPLPGAGEEPTGTQAALHRVETSLHDVRRATELLLARNEEAAGAAARTSRQAAEQARTISFITGAAMVVAAVLVFILVFISVSGPLRRLAHGTRELARGRLEHRLDVRGRHELADLASDFNHMAERLHELDDLKRDFVSHVSHELKGPLASIHETIEVMLEEIPGPLTDKQRDLLTLSRDSSNRLAGMIRNLLEASRLEAGMEDYALDSHDLADLAHSVRREMAGMARDRGQTIELEAAEGDTRFVGDGARIREVIGNLVGNAVKFSPRAGTIRVRVAPPGQEGPGAGDEGGGTMEPALGLERAGPSDVDPVLLLEVEDDGPGVPDQDKSRIFDKFYRVRQDGGEGGRVEASGVGLGLAICQRIAEAHGGELWVENAPSGGARFQFLLPQRPQVRVNGTGWRDREAAKGIPEDPRGDPPEGSGGDSGEVAGESTGRDAPEEWSRSGTRRWDRRATLEP